MTSLALAGFVVGVVGSFCLSLASAYFMTQIWKIDLGITALDTKNRSRLDNLRLFIACIALAPALSSFAAGLAASKVEWVFICIAGALALAQGYAAAYACMTIVEPSDHQKETQLKGNVEKLVTPHVAA